MKKCIFCNWLYGTELPKDEKTREAREWGFCSWPCKLSYEAEKEYVFKWHSHE